MNNLDDPLPVAVDQPIFGQAKDWHDETEHSGPQLRRSQMRWAVRPYRGRASERIVRV